MKSDGAISILCIFIMMCLVLFFGTIIDISRCFAAESEVNSTINMTNKILIYDKNILLEKKYGIVGFNYLNYNQLKKNIKDSVNETLLTDLDSNIGIDLYSYKIESLELVYNKKLSDNKVIKNSILHYMDNISKIEYIKSKYDDLLKKQTVIKLDKYNKEIFDERLLLDEYIINRFNYEDIMYILYGKKTYNIDEKYSKFKNNLNQGEFIRIELLNHSQDDKIDKIKELIEDDLSLINNERGFKIDNYYASIKMEAKISIKYLFITQNFIKGKFSLNNNRYIIPVEFTFDLP